MINYTPQYQEFIDLIVGWGYPIEDLMEVTATSVGIKLEYRERVGRRVDVETRTVYTIQRSVDLWEN